LGTSAPVRGRSRVGKLLANVLGRGDGSDTDGGVEPHILLSGGESLVPYGVNGTVLHTPGHTAGSVSVLLGDGPAFVGDLVSSAFLRRGTPAPGMFAVDCEAMDASIRDVLACSPDVTYASHCAPFPLERMQLAFS
jgi:glyoxylase-like metal-dependent hydrolase (beta-lactamase superfamily II)